MLILPSVGAAVSRIILNESATKAKIFFDDGTSTIISTKNTPTTSSVKKTTVTPNSKTVLKKKVVVNKVKQESASFVPKTKKQQFNMESVSPQAMAQIAPDVIARAKARAEMLERQTMDSSQIAAMATQDGQEVELQ